MTKFINQSPRVKILNLKVKTTHSFLLHTQLTQSLPIKIIKIHFIKIKTHFKNENLSTIIYDIK